MPATPADNTIHTVPAFAKAAIHLLDPRSSIPDISSATSLIIVLATSIPLGGLVAWGLLRLGRILYKMFMKKEDTPGYGEKQALDVESCNKTAIPNIHITKTTIIHPPPSLMRDSPVRTRALTPAQIGELVVGVHPDSNVSSPRLSSSPIFPMLEESYASNFNVGLSRSATRLSIHDLPLEELEEIPLQEKKPVKRSSKVKQAVTGKWPVLKSRANEGPWEMMTPSGKKGKVGTKKAGCNIPKGKENIKPVPF
ncbi:hypothetical protein CYLTODRAFT_493216 [Cylindrobasidium torrendii FP15055 ss-10]|uniref:Uncharacterized protein n=1 Tax=Cylindrobasidium torrendii FP15055 ss-10 TaxID=1314674 RepID=A0A0D7B1H6_9AGAR|nr:hypothetical protein CYLTODRAFT_493216 [Cylindrobasidium torrendii FP15055 ss-10]